MKKLMMKTIIESIWNDRSLIDKNENQEFIKKTIKQLDEGDIRVAEKINHEWKINEWVKKAVIMYFQIQKMKTIEVGPFEFHDKIPLKNNYQKKSIRVVPHAIVRYGALFKEVFLLVLSFLLPIIKAH